jgi:hypothetical protein
MSLTCTANGRDLRRQIALIAAATCGSGSGHGAGCIETTLILPAGEDRRQAARRTALRDQNPAE